MRNVLLVAVFIAAALGLAPGASAHPGGIWFDTARNTEESIYQKYPRVLDVACSPIPPAWRRQYPANSTQDAWTRRWDHFLCAIRSSTSRVCLVIAHHTGPRWHHIVLTTFAVNGCTARDLR